MSKIFKIEMSKSLRLNTPVKGIGISKEPNLTDDILFSKFRGIQQFFPLSKKLSER